MIVIVQFVLLLCVRPFEHVECVKKNGKNKCFDHGAVGGIFYVRFTFKWVDNGLCKINKIFMGIFETRNCPRAQSATVSPRNFFEVSIL